MYYDILKNMEWQLRCDLPFLCKAMTVRIIFSHDEQEDDEVEFCIYPWNAEELAELFTTFCKESHCKNVVITKVLIIRVAESMDALIEMEENL